MLPLNCLLGVVIGFAPIAPLSIDNIGLSLSLDRIACLVVNCVYLQFVPVNLLSPRSVRTEEDKSLVYATLARVVQI